MSHDSFGLCPSPQTQEGFVAVGSCCSLWYLQPSLPTASQWDFIEDPGRALMVGPDVHSLQREKVNMAGTERHRSHSSKECRVGGSGQDHGMAIAGQDGPGEGTSGGSSQLGRTGAAIMIRGVCGQTPQSAWVFTDTEDLEKGNEGCDRPLVTGPISSSEKWTVATMTPFLSGESSKA